MSDSVKNIVTQSLEIKDNKILKELTGINDAHLKLLENKFNISIYLRGNSIYLNGIEVDVLNVKNILKFLLNKLLKKESIDNDIVEQAINMANSSIKITQENDSYSKTKIHTKRKIIFPRTKTQGEYLEKMHDFDMVFGVGPAGTGKTYLAVAMGVSLLIANKIDKIIISRPVVEAGEKLGFLPGDLKEKIDPYLRPIYDALNDLLQADQLEKYMAIDAIEIAPLAFMRGRTLSNAFIILDEAQNTTTSQMKMFLTRIGFNAKMVITGDPSQIDLGNGIESGLVQALKVLKNVKEISITQFKDVDVVRNPVIAKIINAYDKFEKTK